MPERIPQSTAIRVPLQAYLSSDHATPATGKTIAVTISKNGGAYGNPNAGATNALEIANGSYYVDLGSADTGALGPLFVRGTASGIDDIVALYNVVNFASDVRSAIGMAGSNLDAQLAAIVTSIGSITVAVNAGDVTSKQADSGSVITGTQFSGTFANTATNDDTYWITAPTGSGLNQSLVFALPSGRVPTYLSLRGWWNGGGQTAEVYALNSRTGNYDRLTNSGTNLASRNNEALYSIPLPRDYADDDGSFATVTINLRSASTNTSHRLRIDEALVYHIHEAAAFHGVMLTPQDVWTYSTRTLTSPGVDPVTPPSVEEIDARLSSTHGAGSWRESDVSNLDVPISTRAAAATALSAEVWTAERAAKLENLDASVTSRATPAQVNAEVLDVLATDTLVDGKTLVASQQIIAALCAGKASGAGTGTESFLGLDGSTPRAVVTVDDEGNRTEVAYP